MWQCQSVNSGYIYNPEKGDKKGKVPQILDKLKVLLPKIKELDDRRWNKGEELKRGDLPNLKEIIFDNKSGLSASERLLAGWCCSILNRQLPYERVWGEGLSLSIDWIKGKRKEFPKIRLDESRYFQATQDALYNYQQFGTWFIEFGKTIKGPQKGNLYRLVGTFASQWLGLEADQVSSLKEGSPGLIGNWKRLWMFIMMIRRDRAYWMPLFKEAIKEAGGDDFIKQWDTDWYPETECELPVDRRITGFFNELGFFRNSPQAIAQIAHNFGHQEKVSPSILDVVFVPGFNQELWEYGCKKGLKWSEWWKESR